MCRPKSLFSILNFCRSKEVRPGRGEQIFQDSQTRWCWASSAASAFGAGVSWALTSPTRKANGLRDGGNWGLSISEGHCVDYPPPLLQTHLQVPMA